MSASPQNLERGAESRVEPEHPWLGLHSFTEENQSYFFGRSGEIRDIYLRVREHPLTVLYGESGLGKTSLLRAGLVPKLRLEGFRSVRVLLNFETGAPPLAQQVRAAIAQICGGEADVAELLKKWTPLRSLWEIFAHENLRPIELAERPFVLIFDQFEEMFTLGAEETQFQRKDDVRELLRQIADLAEQRPPEELQEAFRSDRSRAREYNLGPIPVRIVLSLREDYVSRLDDSKTQMPSVMRNRMVLRRFTGVQAHEAVVRPGRMKQPPLISDLVGAKIVRFVARRSADTPLEEIEAVPPLVSLICQRLNEVRLQTNSAEITGELVDTQSTDILQRFYDDCFGAIDGAICNRVREFIEDRFITVSGNRNPVAREDACAELQNRGVPEPQAVLDGLIETRLLTAEHRGGTQRLEITHDVLTTFVVQSKAQRAQRLALEQREREQRIELEKRGREQRLEIERREREAKQQVQQAQKGINESIQLAGRRAKERRRLSLLVQALLTAFVGVLAYALTSNSTVEGWTYDLITVLQRPITGTNVMLVSIDDNSREILQISNVIAGRLYIAELVRRLARDGENVVAVDLLLREQAGPADDSLASALRAHGKVLLAAEVAQETITNAIIKELILPASVFRTNAAAFGHDAVELDLDGRAVRFPDPFAKTLPFYARAATLAGAQWDSVSFSNSFINFRLLPNLQRKSLAEVLTEGSLPTNFFKGKIVVVGRSGAVGSPGDWRDSFVTPYSRFQGTFANGAELQALMIANAVSGVSWKRMHSAFQVLLTVITSLVLFGIVFWLRGRRVFFVAAAMIFVTLWLGIWLPALCNIWWNCLGVIATQVVATVLLLLSSRKRESVYISYGRSDSSALAISIAQALKDRGCNVFLDVTYLVVGEFQHQMISRISESDTFIVLLSRDSIERYAREDDWCQVELEAALNLELRIIPVVSSDFDWRGLDRLPPSLRVLSQLQTLTYSPERFEPLIEHLVRFIRFRR